MTRSLHHDMAAASRSGCDSMSIPPYAGPVLTYPLSRILAVRNCVATRLERK